MFHCTSLRLPPEAPIKRESTRPVEFRQPGFDKAFDVSTLFYDLIGRNFRSRMEQSDPSTEKLSNKRIVVVGQSIRRCFERNRNLMERRSLPTLFDIGGTIC